MEKLLKQINKDLKKIERDIKYNIDFVGEFNNIISIEIINELDKGILPGVKKVHQKINKGINPFTKVC